MRRVEKETERKKDTERGSMKNRRVANIERGVETKKVRQRQQERDRKSLLFLRMDTAKSQFFTLVPYR